LNGLRFYGTGCLFALALLVCGIYSASVTADEGDGLITELKVAYIFNFTRFIEWPEAPADRPFVIGVIDDPAMAEQLRILEREGKRVGKRSIAVRGYASPDMPDSCEILFVGAAASNRLEAIIQRTAGKSMLLVGDTPGYADRGVAIELFRKPDIFRKTDKLRFRINPSALKDRGLEVSAQMFDVAEIVK
jgi:hypothetical protein